MISAAGIRGGWGGDASFSNDLFTNYMRWYHKKRFINPLYEVISKKSVPIDNNATLYRFMDDIMEELK